MTDFENHVRGMLGQLMTGQQHLSNNVADIHARVVRHDIDIEDLKRGTVRKSDPPKSFQQWHSAQSGVYHVPEDVMDEVAKALERRDKADKWNATMGAIRRTAIIMGGAVATLLTGGILHWLFTK